MNEKEKILKTLKTVRKGVYLKIVNIVKIENESEYGYSIEMLYNFFRIGLFICSEPKTITFLFGLWKINFIFEAIKG